MIPAGSFDSSAFVFSSHHHNFVSNKYFEDNVENSYLSIICKRYGSGNDYYDNDYDYDDYEETSRKQFPSGRKSGRRSKSEDKLLTNFLANQRSSGATLLVGGLMVTFLGVMLFFNGALLRIGNILSISGGIILVGPKNVAGFFFTEARMQATIITSIGVLLVLWGKPKLGLLIEIFGLLSLFGNMLPLLLTLGKQIPVLSSVIEAFEDGSKKRTYGPRRATFSQRKYQDINDAYGDSSGSEAYRQQF